MRMRMRMKVVRGKATTLNSLRPLSRFDISCQHEQVSKWEEVPNISSSVIKWIREEVMVMVKLRLNINGYEAITRWEEGRKPQNCWKPLTEKLGNWPATDRSIVRQTCTLFQLPMLNVPIEHCCCCCINTVISFIPARWQPQLKKKQSKVRSVNGLCNILIPFNSLVSVTGHTVIISCCCHQQVVSPSLRWGGRHQQRVKRVGSLCVHRQCHTVRCSMIKTAKKLKMKKLVAVVVTVKTATSTTQCDTH